MSDSIWLKIDQKYIKSKICYSKYMEILTKKFIFITLGVVLICLVGGFFTSKFIGRTDAKVQNQSTTGTAQTILAEEQPVEVTPTADEPAEVTKPVETKPTTTTTTPTPAVKTEPVVESKVTAPSYSAAFQWGVTIRPNALGKYSSKGFSSQLDKAKELGVGWARVNWDYDNSNPVSRNTSIIEDLEAKGIKPLLVIEHNPNKGNSNLYQQGLDDASTITGALKGSVNYYQLANEGGAQSLSSGKSGVSSSDYNDTEYTRVKDYIKGLSDGIAKGDPGATRIVTISWTHTGFLDRLVKDGVKFDMIGIDWYSWMGSFSTKKINNTQTVYSKLQTFGKPLSFMEVSTMPTASGSDPKQKTTVNEDTQASFLTSTANWAWANRTWVKGFYHFELADNAFSSGYVDYYGLIKVDKSDSTATLGSVRKAFDAYKSLIKGK
jgi:hypothetical protein